jgi:hypothetical protein
VASLMKREALDGLIAHMPGVQAELRTRAARVHTDAERRLSSARASTTHRKISGLTGATKVLLEHGSVDHYIILEAADPMAIEFGHGPSGFFDPKSYGKITKAPHGLYILTGAGGIAPNVTTHIGRKVGKR